MSRTTSHEYDVVILGAGASGLMCAFTAAQSGKRVLVLEKANKVGKKILMSGGGRCNFTNYFIEPTNFLSQNPHFCKSALSQYTQWDFIAMVEKHGIAYEERKHGQLFCVNSAKDILTMLLVECENVGVQIQTLSEVRSVQCENSQYLIEVEHAGNVSSIQVPVLVVATGALSIPTLGGSGQGYDIASQFGLPLVERCAGLVPFMFSDELKGVCERLSGVSLEVSVSCNGASFLEQMLLTHRGLSGPAMLQISNYWSPGDELIIDLSPSLNLSEWLIQEKHGSPKSLLKTVLQQLLTKKLCVELLSLWQISGDEKMANIPDKMLLSLAEKLHAWHVRPAATEGYRTAEVTLGGVDTRSIRSKTMEANNFPGLYFIGEVLDVTGHLGGYNFQWAWSSAYVAGRHIADLHITGP